MAGRERALDISTLESLEDALIQADLGVEMAIRITTEISKGRYESGIGPEFDDFPTADGNSLRTNRLAACHVDDRSMADEQVSLRLLCGSRSCGHGSSNCHGQHAEHQSNSLAKRRFSRLRQ